MQLTTLNQEAVWLCSSTLTTRRAQRAERRRSGPARAPRDMIPPAWAVGSPASSCFLRQRLCFRWGVARQPCLRLRWLWHRQVLRHPQPGQRGQVRQVGQVVLQRARHRNRLLHRDTPGDCHGLAAIHLQCSASSVSSGLLAGTVWTEAMQTLPPPGTCCYFKQACVHTMSVAANKSLML